MLSISLPGTFLKITAKLSTPLVHNIYNRNYW